MDWDTYFLNMIPMIASKSKDASTKVGCVVVGPDNEIRSTGYNSFVRGVRDDAPERQERPLKYAWIEHAERNSIYNAARIGTSLKGCRIYMDFLPCTDCARAIVQAGIVEIIIDGKDFDKKKTTWEQRWKEQMEIARTMLREASVLIRVAYPKEDGTRYSKYLED